MRRGISIPSLEFLKRITNTFEEIGLSLDEDCKLEFGTTTIEMSNEILTVAISLKGERFLTVSCKHFNEIDCVSVWESRLKPEDTENEMVTKFLSYMHRYGKAVDKAIAKQEGRLKELQDLSKAVDEFAVRPYGQNLVKENFEQAVLNMLEKNGLPKDAFERNHLNNLITKTRFATIEFGVVDRRSNRLGKGHVRLFARSYGLGVFKSVKVRQTADFEALEGALDNLWEEFRQSVGRV